jgi:IS605 OrfB family transposase
MKTESFRTSRINVKDPLLLEAFRALGVSSKNIRNVCSFIARNVLSSFEDGNLKENLKENQMSALNLANRALEAVNKTRAPKNAAKQKKLDALRARLEAGKISWKMFEKRAKKLKASKTFERLDAPGANPWSAIDASVLDQAARLHEDQDGAFPFLSLPGAQAVQARKQVCEEFSSWLAAAKSYGKNQTAFSGRPMMPGYLGKHERNAVKIPASSLGKLFLPSIEKCKLFADFEKKVPLSAEARDAYAKFDLPKTLAKFESMLKRPGSELAEIRIVPKGKTGAVLEGVYKIQTEIPDGCCLAKLLLKAKREKIQEKDFNSFCLKELFGTKLAKIPNSAGADFGVENLVCLSFSNGFSSQGVCGGAFERELEKFDRPVDALKAKLSSPRLRELVSLQSKARDGKAPPLGKEEKAELAQLRQQARNDPGLADLLSKRREWIARALHQTGKEIARLLKERGIQVLFLGRNKGWKTGSDLGRENNRRFHRLAHAALIKTLEYKCLEAGILVLRTEESYTSKTSFAANEPLLSFGSKPFVQAETPASCAPPFQTPRQPAKEISKPKTAPSVFPAALASMPCPFAREPRAGQGARKKPPASKSSALNLFETPGFGRWSRIHADAQKTMGAFNILRKAYSSFHVHNRLSSKFELLWLGRTGLRLCAKKNAPKTRDGNLIRAKRWGFGGAEPDSILQHTP